MEIKVSNDITQMSAEVLVINKFEGEKTSQEIANTYAVEKDGFEGKLGETYLLHTYGKIPADKILVVGFGKNEEFDANKNFVSMNEGMTKAEFQSTYSDFAGINPKKCGSSSGTLSSGGFGDLADSANSKANYNKLKTELTANQPKSILTDDNLDVINDMAKDPEAVKDVLDNITARIRAGEMPSKEMMDEISSEISGKYGIPGAPLASRTKRILEHMDDDWYQIKDFFNTPQKANLSSTSRLKRLDKFMENKNLLPEEQLNARAEQAKIKAQKEAELKAEQDRHPMQE